MLQILKRSYVKDPDSWTVVETSRVTGLQGLGALSDDPCSCGSTAVCFCSPLVVDCLSLPL